MQMATLQLIAIMWLCGLHPLFTQAGDVPSLVSKWESRVILANYKPALPTKVETKPSETAPDLCKDGEVDVIVKLANEQSYVFKGKYYWLREPNEVGGYLSEPRLIAEGWSGLPDDLDAGFTWSDGKTYFFKGDQYWAYENDKLVEGPKRIVDKFPGVPSDLNGAVYYSYKDYIYFFKDRQVMKYQSGQNTLMHYQGILVRQVHCKPITERIRDINYFFDKGTYTTLMTVTTGQRQK